MSEDDTRVFVLREGYEFTFKPTMSAKDFGLMSRFRDDGTAPEEVSDYFEHVNGCIRRSLIASERERWDAIWEVDMDRPFTFNEISELAGKLMSSDAGRPTQQPSPSGPSASTTSTQSTDGSDSKERPALTTSKSVPV